MFVDVNSYACLVLNDPNPREFYLSQIEFWKKVLENPSYPGEAETAKKIIIQSQAALEEINKKIVDLDFIPVED